MKIEIEIDEFTARILTSFAGMLSEAAIDPEAVAAAVTRCVSRYRDFPDTVGRKHLNALAIVRAKAVEAAASSTTEASRESASATADRLLDFMLHNY